MAAIRRLAGSGGKPAVMRSRDVRATGAKRWVYEAAGSAANS
jgi:hypothetical protein